MAERESLELWSTTAASNNTIDPSINWAEGQLPSTVNNSARAMMSAVARSYKDGNGSLTTGGSANAYTLTINNTWTAYATGQTIAFKASFTNTGAATINVTNGDGAALGAKAIRTGGDVALSGGAIQIAGHYVCQYDSAANAGAGAFILLNPSNSSSLVPSVKDYGASGSSTTTTGTISSSSTALSLASAIDFQHGQGVLVNHAGAATAVAAPTGISVAATNATGATTYAYKFASVDFDGGVSAATSATTITDGVATLGDRSATSGGVVISVNELRWTVGTGSPMGTAIWRSKSGGAYELLGVFGGSYIQDKGLTAQTIFWIPSTPPASALAQWHATTIASGAGTTALTLASAATTAATSVTVIHDDTDAFNAVLPSNRSVHLPAGTYNVRDLIINGAPYSLIGEGPEVSIINCLSPNQDTGIRAGLVVVGDTTQPFSLDKISVQAAASMAFEGLTIYQRNGVRVTNSEFVGATGLRFANCSEVFASLNTVSSWWNIGIKVDQCTGTEIIGNQIQPITGETVDNDKTGHAYPFATGIAAIGGEITSISDNKVVLQGGLFGIYSLDSRTAIEDNHVEYTGREAIACGVSDFKVTGNYCYWGETGNGVLSSGDYGFSVGDNGTDDVARGEISGNTFVNSLFSSIAIFGTGGTATLTDISVSDNLIIGSNPFSTVHNWGIEVSGSNTSGIVVATNKFVGNGANMEYCVAEVNQGGTGAPHDNIFGPQYGSSGTTGYVNVIGSGSDYQPVPTDLTNVDLPSNVVTNIANDTNITGSITSQTLTLAWASTLALSRLAQGTNGQLIVGQTSSSPLYKTITGDWTMSAAGAATLATVNSNTGTFGSATKASVVTVNGKGLVTAASESTVTPAVGSITGLGTGVATALAVNVGSAGAFVAFNGALGTPSSGTATNLTGTASGLTAGNVTTNANLTGPITSVGNATSIASQTGTGTKFVVDTSPVLVAPTLGVASATSINFGQTALSNYTEGTWTPTITTDGTTGTPAYTTHTGTYERIGRNVTARFTIVLSGWTGSPTGSVLIAGLPVANGGSDRGTCTFSNWSTSASLVSLTGDVLASASVIRVLVTTAAATANAQMTAANAGTTLSLYGSVSYQA